MLCIVTIGVGGPLGGESTTATMLHQPANLTYSKEDIGSSVQMFSFRFNYWDTIELIDFDPTRSFHKCRNSDGSAQWLDLKKKPIRAVPLDGDREKEA